MLKTLVLLLLILSVSITANATSFTYTGWNIVLGPIIGMTGANLDILENKPKKLSPLP